jgi:hypothetical protein
MQLALSLLLAFTGVFSSAAASPTPQTESSPPCIVPQIFFTSLPDAFTLSALLPGPSTSTQQLSWPVQLSPRDPSKEVTSIPVISRTKILPPSFKLVNETLITANNDIPADLSPTIAIFPPPLQGFTFGGPNAGDTAGKFGAIYSCDSTGQQILKLVADRGIVLFLLFLCFFPSLAPSFSLLTSPCPCAPTAPPPGEHHTRSIGIVHGNRKGSPT